MLNMEKVSERTGILEQYLRIRKHTEDICSPLTTEDYVVQPVVDVSPPKWHIGHTTWFFETFILKPHHPLYKEFNPDYNYVFNSYYESVGSRVLRTDRGNLSRPTVQDIYRYRKYVDLAMEDFLEEEPADDIREILVLGFNHEQQHQELLISDIKYILGHNPLFPAYSEQTELEDTGVQPEENFISIPEGVYDIGFSGAGFCFDNELDRHRQYIQSFKISNRLVTNGEYLEFIKAGGYKDFRFWHSEGWEWVKNSGASAPLYWHFIDGSWYNYCLQGLKQVDKNQALCHVNYYEATAYASWKGMRLPTEAEWETAATRFKWGSRWEWTGSAYLPYPGFTKTEGAIGEYNGKFMVSQMVLKGASIATPEEHSRITYRNFFHPHLQWQFTGIRLAQ